MAHPGHLLAAEIADRHAAEDRIYHEELTNGRSPAGGRQGLHDQGHLDHAETGAAVILGQRDAAKPGVADRLPEFRGEGLPAVDIAPVVQPELLADAPRITGFLSDEARAHFDAVKQYLDLLGIPYTEDPLLVRGLDYYNGVVFELESDDVGSQSALAAGGRYDGLAVSVGGKQPVPAVGWAAGIERLFLALQAGGHQFPEPVRPDAYLVALGTEAQNWTFAEAQRLRAAGFRVEYDLLGRSMKAQMKEANRQRARFAVIVGENELASGRATVRDLDSSEQREVAFDKLINALHRPLEQPLP